jgi:phospholipid/cholesterol/gamma-HCH transport system permease protein
VCLVLEGRITAHTAGPIWQSAIDTLARNPDGPVVVDASRLEYVDNVGLALLFDLTRRERPPGAKVELRELAPNLEALVNLHDPQDFAASETARRHVGTLEHMGRATTRQLRVMKSVSREPERALTQSVQEAAGRRTHQVRRAAVVADR